MNNKKSNYLKENFNKKIISIFGIFFVFITLIHLVSAYQLVCLRYGQTLPPESDNPRYTCWHDNCVNICVDENFLPTNPSFCQGQGGCIYLSNTTIDTNPPNLTVYSPINNEVYSTRSVLFDLTFDKPSSIFFRDNNDLRRGWRMICSNCRIPSYTRLLSFSEGENNLTIKAQDRKGLTTEIDVFFIIDTIKPRITRTEPMSGFTKGEFLVRFREENPVELILHYEDKTHYLDLENDCYRDGMDYVCETKVDVSEFDGGQLEYWFELTDIAGNSDFSRKIILEVDITPPNITKFDYEIDGRNVFFDLEIEEENLEEVGYSYIDERGRLISRRICSRLINGKCQARTSFSDGFYELTVYALDRAGQNDTEQISFFVDSKPPRILSTQPTRSFATGLFEIEFDEENPVNVTLIYGKENEMLFQEVNLGECSVHERISSRHSCEIEIELDLFHGQNIEYYFEVQDVVGHRTQSRKYMLQVDTISPNITSFEQTINRRNVLFNIGIDEENFYRVEYIDHADSKPRKILLCTRLLNGLCTARRSFSLGNHELEIIVSDLAGNKEKLFLDFTIS